MDFLFFDWLKEKRERERISREKKISRMLLKWILKWMTSRAPAGTEEPRLT